MSSPCTIYELDKTRDQWMRAFSPVNSRSLQAWLADWNSAIKTIPYLRVAKVASGGLLTMLEFRVVLKVTGLNLDMVAADIERIWSRQVAEGLKSSHTLRPTTDGFDFHFAALTSGENYVTGMVRVVRKE